MKKFIDLIEITQMKCVSCKNHQILKIDEKTWKWKISNTKNINSTGEKKRILVYLRSTEYRRYNEDTELGKDWKSTKPCKYRECLVNKQNIQIYSTN